MLSDTSSNQYLYHLKNTSLTYWNIAINYNGCKRGAFCGRYIGNADVSVWNTQKDRNEKTLANSGMQSAFHNETRFRTFIFLRKTRLPELLQLISSYEFRWYLGQDYAVFAEFNRIKGDRNYVPGNGYAMGSGETERMRASEQV
jgi:hypothetical protein